MLGLLAAAKQHRAMFYKLVVEAGKDIVIRSEPAAPTGTLTDADRALGIQQTASTTYPQATVTGVVTGPMAIPLVQQDPGIVAPLGLVAQCETIIRFRVDDILVDPNDIYGPTIVDTAHDILIGNNIFKVVATERSGLPPLAPYIFWCGLERAGVLA